MANKPLRVGIFGSGGIAERAMVEPAAFIEGVEVVTVGSRDPERARAFADRFGIPSAGGYADVMADADVDLIYVALPPAVHAEWATAALRAGKHVLCEKPLAANGADARRIAEAAEENGRAAFVGFHYRLHSFTRRVLNVLGSGVLGDIHDVEVDFSIPHFVVKPGNIRLDGDLGGGAVMDVGCYAIDLLRAAWGDAEVVSSVSRVYEADPRVDLETDFVLAFSRGGTARVRASFLGDDEGRMHLHVVGSAATLHATSVIVPQWGATLRVTAGDDVLIDEKADVTESSYAAQLRHLVEVVPDGPSPLRAADAVRTMELVDDVYRAAGLQPR
ncbi:Gfo/Idh/MocA family oxidoreductase [Microbacterium sp. ET2]|uniref:Gfo/Idh/MocA family protein n=1 Tax=Microbacterium albipurpureum TaxID=3050384 RepID=UPI00259CCA4D|nr:Gfo/Idh/MocA family oxidoreductase [Microbacterium sp. ET2 (Ac-2212)]WJL94462.1 Gfo/Idh/MocA family oxidoreductase [Microbacterium sp. ET2 (Ac-2212)]